MQNIIQSVAAWAKTLGAPRMSSSTRGRASRDALGLVAVAALALFCASAPVQAKDQAPFKGMFSFTLSGPPVAVGDKFAFTVAVFGNMTHLGSFTGAAQFLYDPNNFSYTGEATWIAANGDSIDLVFEGRFEPTATAGILANVETVEIVGGTGRFEGATGSAVAGGELDTATFEPTGPAPLAGTISSPGSLKK